MRRAAAVLLLSSLALPAGCGKGPAPPGGSPPGAEAGRITFASHCAACHGPDGRGGGLGGQDRVPPLAGSPWVAGPPGRLIRVVLHGVRGVLEVSGRTYDLEMPSFGQVLGDRQVADVLSYVRREFGAGSAPVMPEEVARVRADTRERDSYWTAEELESVR